MKKCPCDTCLIRLICHAKNDCIVECLNYIPPTKENIAGIKKQIDKVLKKGNTITIENVPKYVIEKLEKKFL